MSGPFAMRILRGRRRCKMTAVVFRSRLRPHADEDYAKRLQEMFGYASKMPGFRSMKGYTADDGENLTLVEFGPAEP